MRGLKFIYMYICDPAEELLDPGLGHNLRLKSIDLIILPKSFSKMSSSTGIHYMKKCCHTCITHTVSLFDLPTQLYLQSRFTWRGSRLLKHFIQAAVLYSAIYVCVSRVSDYKHHWSDVLVGAILGTVVALLVVSVAG